MKEFVRKHEDRIHGVLSCFDRMLFRGYLPIMSGWAMAQFLNGLGLNSSSLKAFLLENSERVKDHAIAMAQKHERPFQYLSSNIRKEDTARQLAERDGIEEGLVCIFSIARALPHFLLSFHRKGVLRSVRPAQVFAPVFLLHGSRLRSDPCAYSDLVSDADPGLSQWPRVARSEAVCQSAYVIPSTTTSFSGSRTWPVRSASLIALRA